MADFKSGKIGKASIAGTDVHIEGWQVNPASENLETSNTGDGGYESGIHGLKSATGQFNATWDKNAQPQVAVPVFDIGDDVLLYLYVGDPLDDLKWNFPIAQITELPMVSEVKGKVTWTCQFKASGIFYAPGISA